MSHSRTSEAPTSSENQEARLTTDYKFGVRNFLILASLKGVGFETMNKIAGSDVSFQAISESLDSFEMAEVIRGFGAHSVANNAEDWKRQVDLAITDAEKIERNFIDRGIDIIWKGSEQYPTQLLDLPDPPKWLFVEGNKEVLNAESIGVVGTRKPSAYGLWLTHYVGFSLADWGMPTVSGLAAGIDQEIHLSSLRANIETIAFLGTGILSDYPKGSELIRRHIVENGGAIATEYLPKDSYSAKNFVRRNRLQAALSQTLIPVEWSLKSGTAHTVNYAFRLRRKIAVIRVREQPDFSWIPADLRVGVDEFVVPAEHDRLSEFVFKKQLTKVKKQESQFRLFEDY